MTQHKFKSSLRRLNVKSDREQIFNELMTGKFPKLKITQVHLIKNGHQVLINYHTIALISHTVKVMLKILQASLQQYVNCELPDVEAGFRKGRGTRVQIANICWVIEKTRDSGEISLSALLTMPKPFDCVDHNKLWKILKERGIPDNLTCLLRNLYAGEEATATTGHGTTGWFQIGKGVCQGCVLLI